MFHLKPFNQSHTIEIQTDQTDLRTLTKPKYQWNAFLGDHYVACAFDCMGNRYSVFWEYRDDIAEPYLSDPPKRILKW